MCIVEYFTGKNIFITGGSGFLGKLLIEKLLRSCPEIGNIYMLVRPKKEQSVKERMGKIKEAAVFNILKKENPDALDKIIAVEGDVCEINLGLSDSDRAILVENINIIFHSAASVRFDDFLKYAIILNVRGTREVAKLALELKHISIFVHVSTTYCNCDKLEVEEKLYPAHVDWKDSITIAEQAEDEILDMITLKYIHPLPNTYTFTKSLAEHVVNDLCKGKIPVTIFRPSVVINTCSEPIAGWNDNFNGPLGLITAANKGILRTIFGNPDVVIDYYPADFVIKELLAATYINAVENNTNELEVYNCSNSGRSELSQSRMFDIGKKVCADYPFSIMFWHPGFSMTRCWYSYYIQVLLFHMIPAVIIDSYLKFSGKKPIMVRLQRKIYIANTILVHFMSQAFKFHNHKLLNIMESIQNTDPLFGHVNPPNTDQEVYDYLKEGKAGIAKYILQEKFDETGIEARKYNRKLWQLDRIVKIILFGILIWFILFKLNYIYK